MQLASSAATSALIPQNCLQKEQAGTCGTDVFSKQDNEVDLQKSWQQGSREGYQPVLTSQLLVLPPSLVDGPPQWVAEGSSSQQWQLVSHKRQQETSANAHPQVNGGAAVVLHLLRLRRDLQQLVLQTASTAITSFLLPLLPLVATTAARSVSLAADAM